MAKAVAVAVAKAVGATLAEATLLLAQVEEAIVETEAGVLRTPGEGTVCHRVPDSACLRMTDNGLPAIVRHPSAIPIPADSPV